MRDPAFLFYDGDAARDVSHMNRLERGCYFDLIQAQRKFHGITTELARKILGNDFDTCWPALEMVLSNDDGVYFINWVRESSEKRSQNSEIQRKRIQDYWDNVKKSGNTTDIPRNNHGNTKEVPRNYLRKVIPLENENEIEKKIDKEEYEKKKEEVNSFSPEVQNLYTDILQFFSPDLYPKNEKQKEEWLDTLDKLIRIDKRNPETIRIVIEATRKDDFWRKNFLSVPKLRKKNREQIMYFTVFENNIGNNGRNRQSDERRPERVNKYWNK